MLPLVYALHKRGFLVSPRVNPWEILSTELPWKQGWVWCKGKIYFCWSSLSELLQIQERLWMPPRSQCHLPACLPLYSNRWKLSKFAAAWRWLGKHTKYPSVKKTTKQIKCWNMMSFSQHSLSVSSTKGQPRIREGKQSLIPSAVS